MINGYAIARTQALTMIIPSIGYLTYDAKGLAIGFIITGTILFISNMKKD